MTETNQALVAVPELADPAVLSEILLYSGREAVAMMLDESDNGEDFSKLVFSIAAIFMGEHDSFNLPKNWEPAKAGAALREPLAEHLASMSDDERAMFDQDENLLCLAVLSCFNEAADIAAAWSETHGVTDRDAILTGIMQDPIFEAHFEVWADTILGDYAHKKSHEADELPQEDK